ncbi:MAG: hypothetical protein EZS28_014681 [Streblomastix strix]|uniref:Uncharacterized protein n=1 Tax=Streblomastix strix TaxID=222440 RepID=A0A5J4W570_9EUKA|nr:MAG: hypothetical protein EZS28_014681 [Streblomastix strix]
MGIQPKTQINTTATVICCIGTYIGNEAKTLTCVHSFRAIRITTDSTEAWGIKDDVDQLFIFIESKCPTFKSMKDCQTLQVYLTSQNYSLISKNVILSYSSNSRNPYLLETKICNSRQKNNDDIIYASNEVFEPPVPNAITKLDLSSQLERQSFLASSGSDPQLIVYIDRITLIESNATTDLFPDGGQLSGYLFKSYPPEARPKAGDQMIAFDGTDAPNTYNIFCYIDQNGPYIISSRQLPSNIALVLNITYYNQYESLKKKKYDANNDGKIDIMDTWNVKGKGQFETQSYVYETVKIQTDLIEA